jgi:transcriptional regulator with XRE-family HTH domain
MTDIAMNLFIESVNELLAQKRLKKTDLAKLMGVPRQTVSDTLSGRHAPSISRVYEFAKALGVPLFSLLMTQEERAKWFSFTEKQTSIEARLAAVERAISGPASESENLEPARPETMVALLELLQEMQVLIGAPPSKNHGNKTGT